MADPASSGASACPPCAPEPSLGHYAWAALAAASSGLCAYHGYRRHEGSIGWALVWSSFGGLFPIFAPAIALAQGLGQPESAPAPYLNLSGPTLAPAPGVPLSLSERTRNDDAIFDRLRKSAV